MTLSDIIYFIFLVIVQMYTLAKMQIHNHEAYAVLSINSYLVLMLIVTKKVN